MTAALAVLCGLLALAALAGWSRYRRLRIRLRDMDAVLADIQQGHTRHKLLADPQEAAAPLCFRLNQIIQQFQQQITALELREGAYQQLLTNLSHDLRTPLASLTGYLEAVDEHYIPADRHGAYIGTARRKADELKRRVDALFDWFKLDAGEMAFHVTMEDVYELTRTAAADFLPLFEQAGMRCAISIPEEGLQLQLDAQAYLRMLGNLLQNALVHSGGDLVELSAGQRPDCVWICVRDNGRGILPQDLPHIFDRLYQCDPARNSKSTGLGLSITRALAAAHGGSVEACPAPGGGCIFTLYFPCPAGP